MTFRTEILPATAFHARKAEKDGIARYFTFEELNSAAYITSLNRYNCSPYKLFNHGLGHFPSIGTGNFLSIDLCPSVNPFEKKLFEGLIRVAETKGGPVPVALCVSGLWINAHQEELTWLKALHSQGILDITWVNHSFSHPYYPDLKDENNFLLYSPENMEAEIIDTERLMLRNGLLPSCFFRLPGLISNGQAIKILKGYGLIPLGSAAWLAKGDPIKDGDIILVHGNGNENPQTVEQFMEKLPQLELKSMYEALQSQAENQIKKS